MSWGDMSREHQIATVIALGLFWFGGYLVTVEESVVFGAAVMVFGGVVKFGHLWLEVRRMLARLRAKDDSRNTP